MLFMVALKHDQPTLRARKHTAHGFFMSCQGPKWQFFATDFTWHQSFGTCFSLMEFYFGSRNSSSTALPARNHALQTTGSCM
mmetsp:Transcript_21674/g.27239  ORF Transcript_21674/g.27239 Transcript_21674/m.27239 type:complete len:82 (-) Transcript_21674:577-822(-)